LTVFVQEPLKLPFLATFLTVFHLLPLLIVIA